MSELELTDKMQIHFSTKIVDHSFTHGLGVEKLKAEEVDKWDLVVQTSDGRWHSITEALPEELWFACDEIINRHVNGGNT